MSIALIIAGIGLAAAASALINDRRTFNGVVLQLLAWSLIADTLTALLGG